MGIDIASASTTYRPAAEAAAASGQRRISPVAPRLYARFGRTAAPLALVLALGAALRLALLARDVPTLDSDEAVIGLMALHLRHGEWSVFFWGQGYMGSLEAMLAAPFVWLFGPSALTLRLAPLLVGLAAVACIALLGSALFSPRVGLVSAALLALGPPFFDVLSVRAYGGYVETLLFGPLLLLLALRGAAPVGRTRRAHALFGLVAGLALWTDVLILPFLAGAVALWWLQRRRDLLRPRAWLPLAGGLLLGVLPAIVENLRDGGATVATIVGLTALGARGAHAPPISLLHNLWLLATVSLPILAGAGFAGTQAAGLSPADFAQVRAQHPLAYVFSLVVVAGAAVVALAGVWELARGARGLRAARHPVDAPAPESDAEPGQVARQGQAALALVGALYLGAFCLSGQENVFATPRYLFPLYAATPLLVGWGARLVRRIGPAMATAAKGPGRSGALLGGTALVALLVWNVSGAAALQPVQTAARDHGMWIAGRDEALLGILRAHHVRTVISNDYWEGLRLTFESGETVVAVMVTPQGHPGFNRYRPYVTRGLADPQPAYVELAGTPEAALRLGELRAGRLPGYALFAADGYVVVAPA